MQCPPLQIPAGSPLPVMDCPDRFHAMVAAVARQQPEAVAVRFGSEQLTYAQVDGLSNRLARRLQREGVGPESLVALALERSPAIIIAILAVMKAGGAYLPLDPGHPRERLAFMLDDSGARLVVTQRSLIATLPLGAIGAACVDAIMGESNAEDDADLDDEGDGHGLCYVMYTSGSTGTPKGVMVEHRGVCNHSRALARRLGIGPGSRVLQFSALTFDASMSEIVMALGSGATLVMGSADDLRPGPELVHLIQREAVSAAALTPSVLATLPAQELSTLTTILSIGEPCREALVQQWAPGRRFFNGYGPTEVTGGATVAECHPGLGPIHIGTALDGVEIAILDENQRPVNSGEVGEICIGGLGVARGYLNRPELDAERFVRHPIMADRRLYRSGDMGRIRGDGNVEFLGRLDTQVKIRGIRIELEEIEGVMAKHPAVQQVAVTVRRTPADDPQLVGYIVASSEGINPRDLAAHGAEWLPAYMIPAKFIVVDSLPRTLHGKVDREALPDPQWDEGATPASAGVGSTTERAMIELVARVLGCDPSTLSGDANVFERGAHSLLAAQIVTQIAQVFGVQLPVVAVFEAPTVAELAARVDIALLPQTRKVSD